MSKAVALLVVLLWAAPAWSLTEYYVDPTATQVTRNGAASTPWRFVTDSGAWTAINSALASDDVTVYFSARIAASDTAEVYTTAGMVSKRTDSSTHVLTFNGRSKYNTDEATPSWSNYTGSNKFTIQHSGSNIALNFDEADGLQSYITVDGMSLQSTARSLYYFGGDHFTVQNCTVNRAIYIEYKRHGDTRIESLHSADTILIDGNDVANTGGECIYVGSIFEEVEYDDGHTNVTISNNTIHDCGSTSGQGDGIDIKHGTSNVIISGNTIYSTKPSSARCIITTSPATITENICYNALGACFAYDSYGPLTGSFPWTANSFMANNVCYNAGNEGITINETNQQFNCTFEVYNNSVHDIGNGGSYKTGLMLDGMTTAIVKNNVVSDTTSGTACSASGVGTLTESNNDFYGTVNGCNAGLNVDPLFTSPTNLVPSASSPLIDAGYNLSVSFTIDVTGATRTGTWDIGAYNVSPNQPTIGTGGYIKDN